MEGDKKNKNLLVIVVVVLVLVALLFIFTMRGDKTQPTTVVPENGVSNEIIDDSEGALTGDVLSVHYVGKLEDGTVFDSSIERNIPFTFTLGAGQVIPGWEKGLAGVKAGEKRTLTVSPEDGYGQEGAMGGLIPPNATLIFEVEVLSVN